MGIFIGLGIERLRKLWGSKILNCYIWPCRTSVRNAKPTAINLVGVVTGPLKEHCSGESPSGSLCKRNPERVKER